MTPDEQLTLWCAGISKCPNAQDECCPDFSCCVPKLAWPLEQRAAFREAHLLGNHEAVERMLLGSLANALSGENVYIAGQERKS